MPKRIHAALLTFILLAVLAAACGLWLRAQQRQYMLNRQLIDALVKGDNKHALALVKGDNKHALALVKGDYKRALALVNEGADPNTRYKPMPVPTPIQRIQQVLHRSSAPVNHSETAFAIACGAGWYDERDRVAFQGPCPEDTQLVQAMLSHRADVDARDEANMTPLMWTAVGNRLSSMRLLLSHGANINAQNDHGDTPLTDVIHSYGGTRLIHLLLDRGARVNMRDEHGITALNDATQCREKEVIAILLAHGADPNIAGKDGTTPLDNALLRQRPDVVALLKRYGAMQGKHR